MNKLSEISLYLLAWCCLLSIFGKNLRHEKDTPGKGELLYVDILLWINSNFIKWIWGWTMLLITPFSILVTYNLNYFEAVCLAKKNLVHKSSASKQVASSKNLKKLAFFTPSVLLHPIVRINFLGTVIWYLFTLLKRVIFNNSGRCLIENSNKAILQASSSQACRLLSTDHLKNKIVDSYWSGFNLSGHNFMINFCLMVVLHECYGFYLVHEKYAGKIQAQNSSKNNPFHWRR